MTNSTQTFDLDTICLTEIELGTFRNVEQELHGHYTPFFHDNIYAVITNPIRAKSHEELFAMLQTIPEADMLCVRENSGRWYKHALRKPMSTQLIKRLADFARNDRKKRNHLNVKLGLDREEEWRDKAIIEFVPTQDGEIVGAKMTVPESKVWMFCAKYFGGRRYRKINGIWAPSVDYFGK